MKPVLRSKTCGRLPRGDARGPAFTAALGGIAGILLLVLLVGFSGSPCQAQPAVPEGVSEKAADRRIQIKVVGVHDGDTLTGITASNEQVKVRLDAIDSPELKQPFGQAAKKALGDKVFAKTVTVTTKKKDRYGRTVGHILLGKRDINLEMLEEGMAWHYREYSKNKRLQQAEDDARTGMKGLWTDPNAVAPWEWRKSERERKRK
jgi:endonuclease YncB( thermonuclease family)